jgi:hypothetical protein
MSGRKIDVIEIRLDEADAEQLCRKIGLEVRDDYLAKVVRNERMCGADAVAVDRELAIARIAAEMGASKIFTFFLNEYISETEAKLGASPPAGWA